MNRRVFENRWFAYTVFLILAVFIVLWGYTQFVIEDMLRDAEESSALSIPRR